MQVLEEALHEHETGPVLEARRVLVQLNELPAEAQKTIGSLGPLPDPLVLTAVFYQTEPAENLTERHLVLAGTDGKVLVEADLDERPDLEALYRFAMGWEEQAVGR